MDLSKVLVAIGIIGLVTFLTRVLPFLFYQEEMQASKLITLLEKSVPGMIMVILVVYCMKEVDLVNQPAKSWSLMGSSLAVAVIHLLFKNPLLSIVGGTALYMALLATVS